MIIFGLYAVLWGKGKEVKKVALLCPIKESNIGPSDDAIDGESECSNVEANDGNDSKHSSVHGGNVESRHIEVIVTSIN